MRIILGLSILLLASCTSNINGRMQDVKVVSNVPKTRVYVNGVDSGMAPQIVTLDRTKQHYLELRAPGYYPYRRYLTGKVNPFFYMGVFGAGIPMIVDAAKGTHKQFPSLIDVMMPTSETPIVDAPLPKTSSPNDDTWRVLGNQFVSTLATATVNAYAQHKGWVPPASSMSTSSAEDSYEGSSSSKSRIKTRTTVSVPKEYCNYCDNTGWVSEKATNYTGGADRYYKKPCPSCR